MRKNPVLENEMKRYTRNMKCAWIILGVNLVLALFALIAQMTAVFSIAELLERVLYGLSHAADGPCTSGLHRSAFCL